MNAMENIEDKKLHLVLVHGVGHDSTAHQNASKFWSTRFPQALVTNFAFFPELPRWRYGSFRERAECLLSTILKDRRRTKSAHDELMSDEALPCAILSHGLSCALAKQALVIASEDAKYGSLASDAELLFLFEDMQTPADPSLWEHQVWHALSSATLDGYSPTEILKDLADALEEVYLNFAAIQPHHRIVDVCGGRTPQKLPAILNAPCPSREPISLVSTNKEDLWRFYPGDTISERIFDIINDTLTQDPRAMFRQCRKLIRRLSQISFANQQIRRLRPATNSFDWVPYHQAVCEWRSYEAESPNVLHISGPPGSGQIEAASRLINFLKETTPTSIVLTYDANNHSLFGFPKRDFYISLIRQLLLSCPSVFPRARPTALWITPSDIFSIEMLEHILLSLLKGISGPQVFCFISGMSRNGSSVEIELVDLLKTHQELPRICKFVLIDKDQACNSNTLRKGNPNWRYFDVVHDACQSFTLGGYVQSKIEALVHARPGYQREQAAILEKLTQPESSFVQAAISLKLLENGQIFLSQGNILDCIGRLPKSLTDTYRLALHDCQKWCGIQVVSLLQWVTHAIRPFELSEIAVVTALITPGHLSPAFFAANVPLDISRDIQCLTGTLIQLVDQKVHPFHGSMHHVFDDPDEPDSNDPDGAILDRILDYLEFILKSSQLSQSWVTPKDNGAGFISTEVSDKALSRYCVLHWPDHYKRMHNKPGIRARVLDIFEKKENLKVWSQLFQQYMDNFVIDINHVMDVAGLFGLKDLANDIIRKEKQSSSYSEERLAQECSRSLEIAVRSSNEQFAEMLLDHGVESSEIVWLAARYGLMEILQKSVELRPESINHRNSSGSTPLWIAAREGKDRVVDFLLQRGANAETSDKGEKDGYTAQHCFAATGNTNALRLLIEADVDMKVRAHSGWTPLMLAAESGAEESVVLLLGHSDIDAQLGNGSSALHMAAYNGYEPICDILLDAGANIRLLSDTYYTPFHEAVIAGHLVVLRKLLARSEYIIPDKNEPAELELSAPFDPLKEGNELLHVAARNKHLPIVLDLLKHDLYSSKRKCSTALLWAAKRGYPEIVAALLASGKIVPVQDIQGDTALHSAANNQSQAIVELLLQSKAGFDINAQNNFQWTPLHCAAKSGRLWTVQTLLHGFPNVRADLKTSNGRTALHLAASYGHTAITLEFLKLPDMKNACLLGDNEGNTALILAVRGGHVETVEALLSLLSDFHTPQELQGAKDAWYAAVEAVDEKCIPLLLQHQWPTVGDDSGPRVTALHLAARKNRVELMELLCDYGANLEARTLTGETPLHWAASADSKSAVRFLLHRGAPVDTRDDEDVTPLWRAAYDGSYDSVQELLNASPKPDVNAQKTSNGWTPLHAAFDQSDITKLLLDAGADPKTLNDTGNPASFEAADEDGGHQTIQHHLDAGMDPSIKNNEGRTILHMAAEGGFQATVELLLTHGCDIDAKDNEGITPIHLAISADRLEVVKCLLEKDVDLEVDCQRYGKPLMAAARLKHTEIINVLMSHDAQVNAVSMMSMSYTALQAAAAVGSHHCVQLLLDHGADVGINGGSMGSPLCAAVDGHVQDCVKLCLEAGADVNFAGPQGTALEMAITNESWAIVDILLDQKVYPNSTSRGRHGTALVAAINSGNSEYVEKLLSLGADPNVQAEGRESCTEAAVRRGDTGIFNLLLTNGMRVHCRNPDGCGALSHAIFWKSLDLVELLWDREDIDINDQDLVGRTPLMYAVGYAASVVDGLLSRQADLNATDIEGGTALMYAVFEKDDDTLEKLIDAGADLLMTESRGRDALYWAAFKSSQKSFDVVLKAVQACGDVNRSRKSLQLAIHAAIAGDNRAFVDRLLEELDSDWQLVDSDDWSPLYTAMRYERVELLAGTHETLGYGPLFGSVETADPKMVPREWHALDRSLSLFREPDTLSISMKDVVRERDVNAHMARADHPMIPGESGVYYFEITLVCEIDDSDVFCIGFCGEEVPVEGGYLGFVENSWGVHSDDGKAYSGRRHGRPFSKGFNRGDVIGCGVNFTEGIAFYTKNGTVIGQAFDNIRGRLYPAISVTQKSGCILRAKFWDFKGDGNPDFKFKGPFDGDATKEESEMAKQRAEEGSSSGSDTSSSVSSV